nr:hypothetical protein [uncultured Neokomagataea sp.]
MSISISNAAAPASVTIQNGSVPDASPTVVSAAFNAQTAQLVLTMSDGSQVPVTGFAAALAQSLGGASLAVLDGNGALMLGGKPRFGVSAAGNLTVPTPLPDTSNGYNPVTGTGELYQNGSGPIQEA